MLAALEADSGAGVRVRFSERVVIPEGSVVVRQDGRVCAPLPAHEGPTDAMVFECDVDWPADVELELSAGVTTALDGRPVPPMALTGRLAHQSSLSPPGGPPSR